MIPTTYPSKKLPDGQQDQGHEEVLHDQGEVYQQPITFRRVSQSGQVEIKIEYLYPITLYPIPRTLYLTLYSMELDTVVM